MWSFTHVAHKFSKYLYEVIKCVYLKFLKCVSSKFLNLECKVLALEVQFLKCTSRKFLDSSLWLIPFLFCIGTTFLCMNGTIRLYSTTISSCCYIFRVQRFELGLDLEVQCLKCPTRKLGKPTIYWQDHEVWLMPLATFNLMVGSNILNTFSYLQI